MALTLAEVRQRAAVTYERALALPAVHAAEIRAGRMTPEEAARREAALYQYAQDLRQAEFALTGGALTGGSAVGRRNIDPRTGQLRAGVPDPYQPSTPPGGGAEKSVMEPTPDGEPTGGEKKADTVDYRRIAHDIYGAVLPPELLDALADAWAETGSAEAALGRMRKHARYEIYFPGNKRPDGSVRYIEGEYRSREDAFDRAYVNLVGTRPSDAIRSQYRNLHEGEVSATEWVDRLRVRVDFVKTSAPTVQDWYERNYGMRPDISNLINSAITKDPVLTEDDFRRRLSASQVGGTALGFGFDRDAGRVNELMQAGLDTREEAQQLYSQAAQTVPGAAASSRRFFDPQGEFGIGDFEDAAVFGRTDPMDRLRRLQRREQSAFSPSGTVAAQGNRLTGLRPY